MSMRCLKARYFSLMNRSYALRTAPEAQLIESRIINLLHFQTLIASKAARSVLIARISCWLISACAGRTAVKRANGCPGKLSGRIHRLIDGVGRNAFRRPHFWHNGAFLCTNPQYRKARPLSISQNPILIMSCY